MRELLNFFGNVVIRIDAARVQFRLALFGDTTHLHAVSWEFEADYLSESFDCFVNQVYDLRIFEALLSIVQKQILQYGATETTEVLLVELALTTRMHNKINIKALLEALPAKLLHYLLFLCIRCAIERGFDQEKAACSKLLLVTSDKGYLLWLTATFFCVLVFDIFLALVVIEHDINVFLQLLYENRLLNEVLRILENEIIDGSNNQDFHWIIALGLIDQNSCKHRNESLLFQYDHFGQVVLCTTECSKEFDCRVAKLSVRNVLLFLL